MLNSGFFFLKEIIMYEVVIRNGYIYDGLGSNPYIADIAILNGIIVAIGKIEDEALNVIDASGYSVSPGFIDLHTHSDLSFLIEPLADSKLRQGCTFELIGNCGRSDGGPLFGEAFDLTSERLETLNFTPNFTLTGNYADYLNLLEQKGTLINIAGQIGHGTLRTSVIGSGDTNPTLDELDNMISLLDECLDQGAMGFSTGLYYAPGNYSRTQEIIKSGIKEVHVSLLDPNPEVNGNGVDRLKLAGIKVLIGEGKEQSGEILAPYLKFVTKGMPFVTVKYAMTLDGKIATYTGDSQWISGTKSRQYVHKLRSENDVILTGIGTVLADNPRLSVRDKSIPTYDFKQPLRVVVDSKGQIPLDSAVFSEHGETLLAVTERFAPSTKSKFRGKEIDVESIPEDEDGRVDLKILLDRLSGNLGMITVLVESGPKLLGTFFDSGLVDKVEVFIAPKIIGGENAFSAVAGKGIEYLSDVMKLENIQVVTIGEDVLIKAYSHGVLSDCYK